MEGGGVTLHSAAAAGAFLCISYRGKLLQHKLIRVQCTKKSTRVPVSPVPQYGYLVQKDCFERLDLQPFE